MEAGLTDKRHGIQFSKSHGLASLIFLMREHLRSGTDTFDICHPVIHISRLSTPCQGKDPLRRFKVSSILSWSFFCPSTLFHTILKFYFSKRCKRLITSKSFSVSFTRSYLISPHTLHALLLYFKIFIKLLLISCF